MTARPFHAARTATLVAFLLTPLLAALAHSQSIDDRIWGTDGAVNAFARSGDLLYVGGSFGGFRPDPPNGWTRWDLGTNNLDLPLPGTDWQVNEIETDGAGGWFLAGLFTKIGGLKRGGLAQVGPGGIVTSFNPALVAFGGGQATIYDMKRSGSTLYLVGSFITVNGTSRPYAAALNVITGALLPWAPAASEDVRALELGSGVVYLAGNSGVIGGSASVAGVDAVTGAPTGPLFPAVSPLGSGGGVLVDVLKRAGNTLYIAGLFDSVAGQDRRRVAAVNLTTGALMSWNPNLGGQNLRVLDLEASSSAVYVCGYTVMPVTAVFHPFLEGRDATTGASSGFSPTPFDTSLAIPAFVVKTMKLVGSTLYVSGGQHFVGGNVIPGVMQMNAATGALLANQGPSEAWGFVYDMEITGTSVAVAGQFFDGVQSSGTGNLGALQVSTGMPANLPAFGGSDPVGALQLVGSTLFVLESEEYVTARNAADGSPNGSLTLPGPARALASDGLNLYVAGSWDDSGTPRGFLSQFDPVTLLENWSVTDFDEAVTAITFANGRLYAGGGFLYVGAEFRELGAAFDASGALDPDWQPGYTLAPVALAADASGVYGAFPLGNIPAASDPTDGTPLSWAPNVTGQVNTLALSASRVYIGGSFTAVDGNSHPYVAALSKTTGALEPWNVSTDGEVRTILLDGTDVYLGGAFQHITVTPPAALLRAVPANQLDASSLSKSLVRITLEELPVGVADHAPPVAGNLLLAPPFPNPASDRLHLRWSLPRASAMRLDLFDVNGRRVRELLPEQAMTAGPHEFEVPLQGLRAGLYFVRLAGAPGEVSVRTISVLR